MLAGIRSVAPVNATGKYLVGQFELPGPGAGTAMLLQNQDEEHVLWSTVFFTLKASAPQPHVQEVDPIHGGVRSPYNTYDCMYGNS